MFVTAVSPSPGTTMWPGPGLHPAALQPRLHNLAWRESTRLSDDGFCDSTASINLSHTLTMGLAANGRTLSHRGLAELGLSTRQAWDLAADNLVVAARSPEGTRFYLRNAAQTALIQSPATATALAMATQVKVPGAPITAWLAHPRTFTILHRHLEHHLGTELIYLAPLTDLLLVLPATSPARTRLMNWAAEVVSGTVPSLRTPGDELITAAPFTYRRGFPSAHSALSTLKRKHAA